MPAATTYSAVSAFQVLVVEDVFLIAMEVAAILQAGGFQVMGPVSTVASALHHIRTARPDAAVLDVSVHGERITPVAQVLLAMKVPFVLASAYVPADLLGEPALSTARNLGKPTPATALVAAMNEFRGVLRR